MPRRAGKAGRGARLSALAAGVEARGLSRRARLLTGPARSVVAIIGLALAGCSMDYRAAEVAEKAGEGVPDTVAVGIVHKIHKNGRLSLVLEAARAETFNAQKKTILTDARFEELDSKGAMATEGQAGSIVFYSDSENAEITGSARVRSASEKAVVTADSLSWENKAKRLTAPADELVVVKKDDGSFIHGTGFIGDFRLREVTFSGRVEGAYVWEEKKDE